MVMHIWHIYITQIYTYVDTHVRCGRAPTWNTSSSSQSQNERVSLTALYIITANAYVPGCCMFAKGSLVAHLSHINFFTLAT